MLDSVSLPLSPSSKLGKSTSAHSKQLPTSAVKLSSKDSVTGTPGAADTKRALLSRAPVVPFGTDLYSWESQEEVEPTTVV